MEKRRDDDKLENTINVLFGRVLLLGVINRKREYEGAMKDGVQVI